LECILCHGAYVVIHQREAYSLRRHRTKVNQSLDEVLLGMAMSAVVLCCGKAIRRPVFVLYLNDRLIMINDHIG